MSANIKKQLRVFIYVLIYVPFYVSAQINSNDVDTKEQIVEQLNLTEWILVGIFDERSNDSIPQVEIRATKQLIIQNKAITIRYENSTKADERLTYPVSLKSIQLALQQDTLIIKRRGRHGIVCEYYIQKK